MNGPPPTPLGAHLIRWRQTNGLTQDSAAHMLGVGATTWSHWETGRRLPTVRLLLLISELTGIPTAFLLCEHSDHCPYFPRTSTEGRDRGFDPPPGPRPGYGQSPTP